jgi:hypothetical protein
MGCRSQGRLKRELLSEMWIRRSITDGDMLVGCRGVSISTFPSALQSLGSNGMKKLLGRLCKLQDCEWRSLQIQARWRCSLGGV